MPLEGMASVAGGRPVIPALTIPSNSPLALKIGQPLSPFAISKVSRIAVTPDVLPPPRWTPMISPQNPGLAPQARVPAPAAPSPSMQQVHRLSDDELLALFPNTPVGLVTLKNGRKQLIFPRPGDEKRFIIRL